MIKSLDSSPVKLSIIVASQHSKSNLRNCLDSILANKAGAFEVIVADCCLQNAFSEGINGYSTVEFLRFEKKTPLSVLLSAGIARAKGELIAVTDSSCVVADDWISSILTAHRAESPVVGGAVEMKEGGSLTDWAAYFCDYAQFTSRAAHKGTASGVAGNNFSVKRWSLTKGTEFVEKEFWKTYWCRRLQAEGIKLFFDPAISVVWNKTCKLIPFLIRRFYQGRCFAGMRVKNKAITKRIFYAAGTFILPFLFSLRIISTVWCRGLFVKKFLWSAPIIFSGIFLWTVGETTGYLIGIGNSGERID